MDEKEEYLNNPCVSSCRVSGDKDIPDTNAVDPSINFRVIRYVFNSWRGIVRAYGALGTQARVSKVAEHGDRWGASACGTGGA